jgi:MoaE-MoaD fusion protein
MRVQVLLFGVLRDLLSGENQMLELPQGSTVETLLRHYRERVPEIEKLWPTLAVAVNRNYATLACTLSEGDEVALLPPVSGGSDGQEAPGPDLLITKQAALSVALVREPIDVPGQVAALKCGDDGAVVVFEGTVRNNTRGRRTLYLTYEAYEEMALRLMQNLAREAMATRGARSVALIHRLGRLEVGEISVFIAVASAHRAQAFDACRWLIDTLKKTVPIWKKEHFEDGAVWVDGEPFPPGVTGKGSGSA